MGTRIAMTQFSADHHKSGGHDSVSEPSTKRLNTVSAPKQSDRGVTLHATPSYDREYNSLLTLSEAVDQ